MLIVSMTVYTLNCGFVLELDEKYNFTCSFTINSQLMHTTINEVYKVNFVNSFKKFGKV